MPGGAGTVRAARWEQYARIGDEHLPGGVVNLQASRMLRRAIIGTTVRQIKTQQAGVRAYEWIRRAICQVWLKAFA